MDLDFTLAHGPKGLRVTQNVYFSLLTLTKKPLLVTFCDPTAETGVTFKTDGRRRKGSADRRGSRNSYLDLSYLNLSSIHVERNSLRVLVLFY